MALTADEKEAIMAARGEAHTPALISTKIRRYDVEFADGKTCTALDMTAAPAAEKMQDIREQFQPGYVVKITAR